MSLNDETSWVLKWGTVVGLAIMAVGLVLSFAGFSEDIMAAGILVLIFTPAAGVVVTTKCLVQEKDWKWVKVAILLIIILQSSSVTTGIVIAMAGEMVLSVTSEAIAVVSVMPAEGPSFGVAPSGTWMCRSFFSKSSALSGK